MAPSDVTDTVAYRICSQMLEHSYGQDEELGEPDFASLSKDFSARGGSWESVVTGSVDMTALLGECLDRVMSRRRLLKVARRVAARRVAR